jgi:hypothetical protein
MRFKLKLGLLIATAIASLLVFGLTASLTLSKVKVGGELANERKKYLDLAADLTPSTLNIIPIRFQVRKMIMETDASKLQGEIAEFQNLKRQFEEANVRWTTGTA